MNREKRMMQTGNSAGEYLAPNAKVVEIKTRRVLCQSQNSGNYPGLNNDDDDDPYGF